jgi:hypothetical protein
MGNHVIIAPHPDDELIGTFEVLQSLDKDSICMIFYTSKVTEERRKETLNLKKEFSNINLGQYFSYDTLIQVLESDVHDKFTYYFPDPTYEIHPHHRQMGNLGENYLRKGYEVIFYTTNMNAPYIHEVENPDLKKSLLDKIYPSQKSLWETERKYILFEGRVQWLMK